MRGFLSEFVRGAGAVCTMVIVDESYQEQPRRYRVRPFRLLLLWAGSVGAAVLLSAAAITFTPLRQIVSGYGTAQMKRNARANARQVAALEDSLRQQGRYLQHLRSLMTGPVDSSFVATVQEAGRRGEASLAAGSPRARPSGPRPAGNSARGEGTVATTLAPARSPRAGEPGRGQLQFPVFPPAEGFVTRGFDAESGHYAVDIAAEVGTPVRSIGEGYVVMADRTQEGGQAIAVQHAGGYLSLYKHNRRLLKHVGERVGAREIIAESGNSGEITTGPHLHVELWQNGLARDPAAFFIGG